MMIHGNKTRRPAIMGLIGLAYLYLLAFPMKSLAEETLVNKDYSEMGRSAYERSIPLGLHGVKDSYELHEEVELLAGYFSSKNSLINYDFYYPGWAFCRPDHVEYINTGMLSMLFGLGIVKTGVSFEFLRDVSCEQWCGSVPVPKWKIGFINDLIALEYSMRLYVGDKKVKNPRDAAGDAGYQYEIPIGRNMKGGSYWLNLPIYHNYYNFEIYYLKDGPQRYVITDAVVKLESRRFRNVQDCNDKNYTKDIFSLNKETGSRPGIFYSVRFIEGSDSGYTVPSGALADRKLNPFALRSQMYVMAASFLTLSILPIFFLRNKKIDKEPMYSDLPTSKEGAKSSVFEGLQFEVIVPPGSTSSTALLVANGAQILLVTIATCVAAFFDLFGSIDTILEATTRIFVTYAILLPVNGFIYSVILKLLEPQRLIKSSLRTFTIQPLIITSTILVMRYIVNRHSDVEMSETRLFTSLILLYISLTLLMCAGAANSLLVPSSNFFLNKGSSLSSGLTLKGSVWRIDLVYYILFTTFMQFLSLYPLASLYLNYLWARGNTFTVTAPLSSLFLFVLGVALSSAILDICCTTKGYHNWNTIHKISSLVVSLYFVEYGVSFYFLGLDFHHISSFAIYTLVLSISAFILYTICITIGVVVSSLLMLISRRAPQKPILLL